MTTTFPPKGPRHDLRLTASFETAYQNAVIIAQELRGDKIASAYVLPRLAEKPMPAIPYYSNIAAMELMVLCQRRQCKTIHTLLGFKREDTD